MPPLPRPSVWVSGMAPVGERGRTASALDAGVPIAVDVVRPFQSALQFRSIRASLRLDPALADALGPFHDAIRLWTPGRVPRHGYLQAEQPQG